MFVATKLANVSYGETAFSGHKYDQTLIQSVQRADEENKLGQRVAKEWTNQAMAWAGLGRSDRGIRALQ